MAPLRDEMRRHRPGAQKQLHGFDGLPGAIV
jgi:hypothetical protein